MSAKRISRLMIVLGGIAALVGAFGCASDAPPPKRAPATRPVTDVDPKFADPQYWIAQPGTSWVEFPTYDALFKAAQTVASDYHWAIDRTDYRAGVVTTRPVICAQFFEPWRRDIQTIDDSMKASAATYRRSVRFEISRQRDGSYELTPKVLVEREVITEKRISNAMYFREVTSPRNAFGTRETDVGVVLPYSFWYATGRDHTLERSLAADVYNKLYAEKK